MTAGVFVLITLLGNSNHKVNGILDTIPAIQALASIIQSSISVLAIIIGGLWVYRKFVLKRETYPRADISHQVTWKPLTRNKTLLSAVVTISNNGSVLIHLKEGEMRISQVLPLIDEMYTFLDIIPSDQGEILANKTQKMIQEDGTEIIFPRIGYMKISKIAYWEIEPGNKVLIRFDFVISNQVQSIRVDSFFVNSAKRPRRIHLESHRLKFARRPLAWHWTTEHDLIPQINTSSIIL